MISFLLNALLAAGAPAPDVVVVCPAAFQTALEPWLALRRAQGRVVEVLPADRSPQEIKAAIRAVHEARPGPAVLLVGDAEPAADEDPTIRARCVRTYHAPARVNVLFGSEPEIATDDGYVDFDDDGVPECPIGRLPVDSAEELSRLVERILAYEHSTDFGPWRRRINFVAGVGGFGPVADTALENAAKTLLTRYMPAGFATSMTYAGPTSPYSPGPAAFQSAALGRFNEGCLLWVYIGHGSRREVDRIRTPLGAYPILGVRDAAALAPRPQPPLACFLSCYSGAFDGADDCLAEEMLRADGGPIGVMCGSRVTMPYAMSILGQELMTSLFHDRRATLGDVLCRAKSSSVGKPRDDDESRRFDALATMLMPMAADLEAQRREHVHLFNLLGDPLLRLRHPEDVPLLVSKEAAPGASLAVRGKSPIAGRATIELVVRRDRLTFAPPDCDPHDDSPSACLLRLETYRRANDPRLFGIEQELPVGEFSFALPVPAEARGDCHVRVYVEGREAFALGSADVRVLKPVRTK